MIVYTIFIFMFGQMVHLPEILFSEIMPVPIALAELKGLLKSGDKSLLQKRLENIDCPESININGKYACLIIDGQALVCSLGNLKDFKTFG